MDAVDWYFLLGLVAICGGTAFGAWKASWDHQMKWIIGGTLVLTAVAIAWGVRAEGQWEVYKKDHHCERTGDDKTTFVTVGKTLVPVKQYKWICDDGTEHWHSDD
jgi:hypothetical protein